MRRPPLLAEKIITLGWLLVLVNMVRLGYLTFLPLALFGGLALVLRLRPEADVPSVALGTVMVYGPVFSAVFLHSLAHSQPSIAFVLLALNSVVFGTLLVRDQVGLRWLIPAFFFGLLLAHFSSGAGGADHMIDWFRQMFGWSQEDAENRVHILRKTIHVSFYGVMAVFAFQSWYTIRRELAGAVRFALLWALPHAIFDEWRQVYEPNRGASVWDVLLDMAGAALFLAVIAGFVRRGRPPLQPN